MAVEISVVIPVHNSAKYLERCIGALESQDYPRDKYEIIMVDNNSTDDSYLIMERHPSVKLLCEPRQGSYAARNRGLAEATGSIIAFTDSDCVPQRNWLRSIADAMKEDGAGIVMGLNLPANDSRFLSMYETYQHYVKEYIFGSGIKELYYGYTNNMAVRRELLDQKMPFAERMRGADTIFVRRSVDKYSTKIVRYDPEMQVRHLEMNSIADAYIKMYIYGRSQKRFSNITRVRALKMHERYTIFSNAKRTEGYSMAGSVLLIVLLALGWISSKAGDLTA